MPFRWASRPRTSRSTTRAYAGRTSTSRARGPRGHAARRHGQVHGPDRDSLHLDLQRLRDRRESAPQRLACDRGGRRRHRDRRGLRQASPRRLLGGRRSRGHRPRSVVRRHRHGGESAILRHEDPSLHARARDLGGLPAPRRRQGLRERRAQSPGLASQGLRLRHHQELAHGVRSTAAVPLLLSERGRGGGRRLPRGTSPSATPASRSICAPTSFAPGSTAPSRP